MYFLLVLITMVVNLALHNGAFAMGVKNLENNDRPLVKDCSILNPCSCHSSDLGVIDLKPLANTDGTPRFEGVLPTSNTQRYFWNPCVPFTTGDCHNVAACQKVTFTSSIFYSLGNQASAKFSVTEEGLVLSYTADTLDPAGTDFVRTAYIKLICDLSEDPGEFIVIGEDQTRFGHYHFTLKSIHACPAKMKPSPQIPGLSVGSCLLIGCSLLIVFYVSIGVAVQIFVLKKSGKDAIPNKVFWVELPGLLKDGVMFIVRKGKTSTYEELK
ncbi:uncharacterized protein LOC101852970 [Aplysia californica]|uniref:Autophagy-related protein 27 n=1 Tax=Aplysia californica TaxID=6500 RepID=A0ABM1ACM1_APLCA|nr:uncharacterized protein LOC101852970 [Aplysia californica]